MSSSPGVSHHAVDHRGNSILRDGTAYPAAGRVLEGTPLQFHASYHHNRQHNVASQVMTDPNDRSRSLETPSVGKVLLGELLDHTSIVILGG